MLHHVSIGTNDLDRARAFYDAVMPAIGLKLLKHSERIVAYGLTETIFSVEKPADGRSASVGNGTHVAFHAGHRSAVDDFHRQGLRHGGTDEGRPGLRDHYDPHYYSAFLRDPDGNKIEAVTFAAD